MLSRGPLFVTLTSVILGMVVTEESMEANREGKLWGKFPILKLVTFKNDPCTTTSGGVGTCYTPLECFKSGGTAEGDCAEKYGVCCNDGSVAPNAGGNTTITGEGGIFFNPGDSVGEMECYSENIVIYTATLIPPADVVQFKIDIRVLDLVGPTDGDCTNDTLEFIGANPGLKIPILCGKITDQQLYVGMDFCDGPYKIVIKLRIPPSVPRKWDIVISFLTAADPRLAPPRCLQYKTETEGLVQSFNFQGDPPMMINDQVYSICFKYIRGYCDVMFNFERFDLGPLGGNCVCGDEFILIGNGKHYGDHIGYQAQANASTGIRMDVVSNDINESQMEGFSGSYTMMGC